VGFQKRVFLGKLGKRRSHRYDTSTYPPNPLSGMRVCEVSTRLPLTQPKKVFRSVSKIIQNPLNPSLQILLPSSSANKRDGRYNGNVAMGVRSRLLQARGCGGRSTGRCSVWTDFRVLEADGLPAVKQGSYPIRRACGRSTLRPSFPCSCAIRAERSLL
jgi:hypothetical protein